MQLVFQKRKKTPCLNDYVLSTLYLLDEIICDRSGEFPSPRSVLRCELNFCINFVPHEVSKTNVRVRNYFSIADKIMEIDFYWLPNCTTCQKAKRRLDYHRVPVAKFRDIKQEPLTRPEVERLAALVGGAANLFSRRSNKFRELGLKDKTLAEHEMLDLMANEYTFLKRPILVVGEQAVAGFFEKEYDDFFRSR